MEFIIVGCGRVGAELAFRLFQRGHKVVIIDHQEQAFHLLHPDFRGRTVEGEALNQDVLIRAGIERCDGLAVVTNSDTLNAAVAHLARTAYKIKNIIVRNYDVRWRALYDAFDLPVISATSWGAQRIEELLYHQEVRTVFSAGNGEVEIYEFTIPGSWSGRKLADLIQSEKCIPVALSRNGGAILPDPEIVFQEGDVFLVSATLEGIEGLRRRLEHGQEA